MKKLTNKEKEIMDLYWQYGPMFVRELQEHYAEYPRPYSGLTHTFPKRLLLCACYGRLVLHQECAPCPLP